MKRPLRVLIPKLSRRQFLQGAAASAALLASGCRGAGRSLNFYNWSLFIGPDTIPSFEKETGIRVNYEEFSSADVMYAKLKIGLTGYDLVVSPEYMLRRLIRQKLVQPLPSRPPGERLYPWLQKPPWDPELKYSVPYLWGTTGVGYLKDKVQGTPDSWDTLWDPRYKGRVTILDEKRDAIGAALIRLGFSGNSVKPTELAKAKASLLEQKDLVRRYTSDFTDDLIRGETWVALGWSGDVHQAISSSDRIAYFIPKEGSFFFVDNLCIPARAPHPEEAMQFLLYYMQPEVAASVTNARGYANPIEAAEKLVNPALLGDPLAYPADEIRKRLVFQEDLGESERLWDQLWEEVKR